MSRPASSVPVQYVGIDDNEMNSTDVPASIALHQPLTTAEGSYSPAPAPEPRRCKGRKLCLAKAMIWVALGLFIAAIVTPNWIHSVSTVRVMPPPSQDEASESASSDENAQPPAPTPEPPAEESSEEGSAPPPPPDHDESGESGHEHGHGHGHHRHPHGHGGHHGHGHGDMMSAFHPVKLADNSTLISVTANTGLWRTCVNDHCFKMRCCKKEKASPLCGRSKASGVTLIVGAALSLVSLLFLCCQSRGKFAGSCNAYIAPFLLLAVLGLGTASLMLAGKTRHMMRKLDANMLMPRFGAHSQSAAPPQAEFITRDVQFGASFFMAAMALGLLFFAFLAVLCNSCHERRSAPRPAGDVHHCEGRRRCRGWFWRRSAGEARV